MKSTMFKRKYFLKVLTILALSFFIGINLISYLSYRYYSNGMLNQIYRSNVEMLNETSRVNEFVSRNIVLTGMNLFHEPLIQGLMREDTQDNFQVVQAIRRLDSVQAMGDYVHSIYVYNPFNAMVYTTSNMENRLLFQFKDQDIRRIINNPNTISLHPIPRMFEDKGRSVPVYSYIFSNRLLLDPGYVIININMNQLNRSVLQEEQGISIIIDENERIVYHEQENYFLQDASKEEYARKLRVYSQDSGYFLGDYQGAKSLTVFNRPHNQKWTFLRIIPYKDIMVDLLEVQRAGFMISITFLLIGLLGAFMLTKRIYRPIQNLMNGLKSYSYPLYGDELGVLQTHMSTMEQKTEKLQTHNQAILSEMQNKILREIVLGYITDRDEIEHLMEDYAIPLESHGHYAMVLCYKGKGMDYNPQDHLQKSEVYRDNIGTHTLHIFHEITQHALNQFVTGLKVKGVEFIAMDEDVYGVHQFFEKYEGLERLLKDRIFYPKGFAVDVKSSIRVSKLVYPMPLERELIQHVKRGEQPETEEVLEQFIEKIATSGFDLFTFNAVRLLYALQTLIAEQGIEAYFEQNRMLTRDHLVREIESYQGIQELKEYFLHIIHKIHAAIEEQKKEKQWKYVEQVDSLIETNFQDPQFGISVISEMVSLSGTYLNQMYKSFKEVSISEALLQFRMERACELLKQNTMTVKDVAKCVGFENYNYFYTVFKKSMGITPGKYKTGEQTPEKGV